MAFALEMRREAENATTSITNEDLLAIGEILVARTYLYTLLHKLLATAPDHDVMECVFSQETYDVLHLFAEENGTLSAFEDFLHNLQHAYDLDVLKKIRGEYTRLFIGPAEPVALPYASPYKTHDYAIVQENTVDVRSWYRRNGMEPRLLNRVPDDHVALICAYCAALSTSMTNAFLNGDDFLFRELLIDQLQFVPEHLASWVDDYAFRMRASVTSYFYPQLIEALASFVHEDESVLAQIGLWIHDSSEKAFSHIASEESSRIIESMENALEAITKVEGLSPMGCSDCELRMLK